MTTATPTPQAPTLKEPIEHIEVPEPVSYVPQQTLYLKHMPGEGSFVELNDHRLLYVPSQMTAHATSDGGFNWEDLGMIAGADGQKIEGQGRCLLRLPSGGIGLVFMHDEGLWFTRSDDEAKTWSQPERLSEHNLDAVHALHDAAIVTSSGRIVVAAYKRMGRRDYVPHKDAVGLTLALHGDDWDLVGSHTFEPHPLYSWVYYSDDEGRSWQRNENGEMLVTIDYEGGGHYSCEEPTVVEYAPGHLMMLHRTPLGRFYQSWSTDDGTNWTRPEPTQIASARAPGSLKLIPGSTDLLLVWNQATANEIINGLQRHRLSAAISSDGGATWKNHQNLVCRDPNDTAYCDVPPIQSYRAQRWSPRLPLNDSHTTYPATTIWEDILIVMYHETHRRIYRGPDNPEYRSNSWSLAVPLSLLREPAAPKPQRVPGQQRQNLRNAMASRPDRIVYVPPQQKCPHTENQHFLVTETLSGAFLAVWTRATGEAMPDQHFVASRSTDRGRTWSPPAQLAPEPTRPPEQIASWGFPVVVPHTGRIYVFWNQNIGITSTRRDLTALLAYRWSDDDGLTWSNDMHMLSVPKAATSDPDPDQPENFVIYQAPIITRRGEVMVGFGRMGPGKAVQYLFDNGCESWFLRFDNILTESDPSKLTITVFPQAEHGLSVPWPEKPQVSCCQEPTIQDLSDGRMICVMRTATGYIYYALSSDGGHSWDQPRPLRYSPGGPKIQQPVCPCPLYKLADGRFILVFHNTDGTANGGPGPCGGTQLNRRPAYVAIGREINHPDHPIMFTKPKFLADNRGIIDGLNKTEICTYTSLIESDGEVFLWYPDRKHYLLGKILSPQLLSDKSLPV